MMERNSFSVLFFLKKTKLLKNGEASVCMRITVNNVRAETNIRKSISPSPGIRRKSVLVAKTANQTT
jgi:hypothetical protein